MDGVELPPPPRNDLEAMALAAPHHVGAEYLTADLLATRTAIGRRFWWSTNSQDCLCRTSLKRISPVWNVVGRVRLHLAENRKDEQTLFAFLATYPSRRATAEA